MASRRMFGAPAVLFLALVLVVPVGAQVRVVTPAHSAHFAPTRQAQTPPFISGRRNRFTHRGRDFYNAGLFYYPNVASDYYDTGEPEPPVVQPIVVQPIAQAQQPVAKAIEPLVLEEHDGEWTRVPVGSEVSVGGQSSPANPAGSRVPSVAFGSETGAPKIAAELPPAVLVFRDGHREQVRNYTIEGNSLYTNADYWSTGSWTRKIALGDLNIPATLKVNSDRGAKFNLPQSPNQIVVRF